MSIGYVVPKKRLGVGLFPLSVVAYISAALLISPSNYFSIVTSRIGSALSNLVLILLLTLMALIIKGAAHRPYSRSKVLEVVTTGTMRFLIATITFYLCLSAFTTLKLTIPSHVPFYLDPYLADADLWLHNAAPNEIVHGMVPSWAALPLFYLYIPAWVFLWIGLVIYIAVQDDESLRQRYFWCMLLSIALIGNLLATGLSSVGPIFYDRFYEGNRFSTLLVALNDSSAGPHMAALSNYLYENYARNGNSVGTGISAMPSVHLLVVTLNACMLSRISLVFGFLAWTYAALILLGSVYFGWHYAVDGYVSVALVSVIWWLCGRLQSRQQGLEQSQI